MSDLEMASILEETCLIKYFLKSSLSIEQVKWHFQLLDKSQWCWWASLIYLLEEKIAHSWWWLCKYCVKLIRGSLSFYLDSCLWCQILNCWFGTQWQELILYGILRSFSLVQMGNPSEDILENIQPLTLLKILKNMV